jgi:hypothetical protein
MEKPRQSAASDKKKAAKSRLSKEKAAAARLFSVTKAGC